MKDFVNLIYMVFLAHMGVKRCTIHDIPLEQLNLNP